MGWLGSRSRSLERSQDNLFMTLVGATCGMAFMGKILHPMFRMRGLESHGLDMKSAAQRKFLDQVKNR